MSSSISLRQVGRVSRVSSIAAMMAVPVVALGGCAPNTSGNTVAECRPLSATPAQRPAGWSGTVFTIVMENHDRSQIVGDANAPYINSLVAQGAEAAGYHDSYVHPSEPNYIWMVAGENFGILNDDDPHSARPSPARHTWPTRSSAPG